MIKKKVYIYIYQIYKHKIGSEWFGRIIIRVSKKEIVCQNWENK